MKKRGKITLRALAAFLGGSAPIGMDDRFREAARDVAADRSNFRVHRFSIKVKSQFFPKKWYTVVVTRSAFCCTCPIHKRFLCKCKHIYAAELFHYKTFLPEIHPVIYLDRIAEQLLREIVLSEDNRELISEFKYLVRRHRELVHLSALIACKEIDQSSAPEVLEDYLLGRIQFNVIRNEYSRHG